MDNNQFWAFLLMGFLVGGLLGYGMGSLQEKNVVGEKIWENCSDVPDTDSRAGACEACQRRFGTQWCEVDKVGVTRKKLS